MQYQDRRPAWGVWLAVIGVALVIGMLGGGVAGAVVAVLAPRNETPATRSAANGDPARPSTVLTLKEESAITGTVKKVVPGVVTLLVQAQRTDNAGRIVRETNLGSGVVIDPRGFIITNQHVVENAVKITVKLASGAERPGVLVGDDSPFTDIAIIRVQPDGLTAVPVGDSDALELGQQLLAIGSIAFGVNATDFRSNVTRGIVSGLHRRYPRQDTVMEDLIQTDAAVNHGNSGGALVNLGGELVGITTTVVRGTQNGFQVQGVAFAISSKTFMPIADAIMNNGRVARPYVGIQHQQVTEAVARQAGLSVPGGAIVLDVIADSPAARAGIRRGDVITKLAGVEITEDMPYLNVLVQQHPGATVPVTLLRGGREMTVEVTVGERLRTDTPP